MIDHLHMMIEELPSENEDLISQHKLTWHSQGAYGGYYNSKIYMDEAVETGQSVYDHWSTQQYKSLLPPITWCTHFHCCFPKH